MTTMNKDWMDQVVKNSWKFNDNHSEYLASIISPAQYVFHRTLLPATKEHPHTDDYTSEGLFIPADMRQETDDEFRIRIFEGMTR